MKKACSHERVALREAEALLWWRIHQEGFKLYRADPTDPAIDLLRDDLEVLLLHTEWPLMRKKCIATIALDDAVRRKIVTASTLFLGALAVGFDDLIGVLSLATT